MSDTQLQPKSVEEWKPIAGMEASYSISNLGRIRSRVRSYRILEPCIRSRYLWLTLCPPGAPRVNASVHRLVAAAFCDKPDGADVVNHIDGNKLNNHASNLEWVNKTGNQIHAADIGLTKRGEDSHLCKKLTEGDVREIFHLRSEGFSQSKIASLKGVSQTHVSKILRHKKWRHVQPPTTK